MKCLSGNTSFLQMVQVSGGRTAIAIQVATNTGMNINTIMKQLSEEDLSRFTRHFSLADIGREGQEKLKNARVLVIGAGGLGSPLLIYLAAAGVGSVGIVDDDTVSVSNLQRQILYTTAEVGLKKVEIASQKLAALYPEINIRTFDLKVNAENAENLFKDYDVIADCTDNYKTRWLIGQVSAKLNKPLAFASVLNFEGQISVFNYNGGPAFADLFPQVPKDGIYQESEIGLIGVLPGIAGTLQANEVIKIITRYGEVISGRLMVFNIKENKFSLFRF
jgi:sulfur-carrier protein adenylyltransferase/sulfurtransferase